MLAWLVTASYVNCSASEFVELDVGMRAALCINHGCLLPCTPACLVASSCLKCSASEVVELYVSMDAMLIVTQVHAGPVIDWLA